ncbi:MAG TPA: hypothetical protein VE544_11255 [Nitrososphaeraceae archaeon]|nr:hypothetical protein [Nitrososphaeraceae archaeon]
MLVKHGQLLILSFHGMIMIVIMMMITMMITMMMKIIIIVATVLEEGEEDF